MSSSRYYPIQNRPRTPSNRPQTPTNRPQTPTRAILRDSKALANIKAMVAEDLRGMAQKPPASEKYLTKAQVEAQKTAGFGGSAKEPANSTKVATAWESSLRTKFRSNLAPKVAARIAAEKKAGEKHSGSQNAARKAKQAWTNVKEGMLTADTVKAAKQASISSARQEEDERQLVEVLQRLPTGGLSLDFSTPCESDNKEEVFDQLEKMKAEVAAPKTSRDKFDVYLKFEKNQDEPMSPDTKATSQLAENLRAALNVQARDLQVAVDAAAKSYEEMRILMERKEREEEERQVGMQAETLQENKQKVQMLLETARKDGTLDSALVSVFPPEEQDALLSPIGASVNVAQNPASACAKKSNSAAADAVSSCELVVSATTASTASAFAMSADVATASQPSAEADLARIVASPSQKAEGITDQRPPTDAPAVCPSPHGQEFGDATADTTRVSPVPPSGPAPTRPPRPTPQSRLVRPKPDRTAGVSQAIDFPSEEAVASMSRRERIALLERESKSPGAAAGANQAIPAEVSNTTMMPEQELPRSSSRGRVPMDLPSTARAEGQRPIRESSVPRRRQDRDVEERGRPPVVELSDEAYANMSRRERIALLEKADGGASAEDASAWRLGAREPSASRRGEDSNARRRDDSSSGRQANQSTLRSYRSETPDQSQGAPDDALEDEAWLEQRRQNRKMRLQHHRAPRSDVDLQHTNNGAEGPRHTLSERRRIPRSGEQAAVKNDTDSNFDGATLGTSAAEPVQEMRMPFDEVEELARLSINDPRWRDLCSAVAGGAHRLSSGGLIRAIEAVSCKLADPTVSSCPRDEHAVGALRGVAEALLGCITPQLGSLSTGVIADALAVMAAVTLEEQTSLDMLLAQLLVLLRRDKASFTPAMLSRIGGAIGTLHAAGVSAKRAGSGASSAANRRCLEALTELIHKALEEFSGVELAGLGGSFIVNFMDDVLRRAVLRRAAELEVGLAPGSEGQLLTMQGVEQTVRQHSFAFIASLPDQTKDYLTKLKASSSA
mmetsp:Transcript_23490/g.42900  ORF Transcript_23490/g.42900 Transcript_23490/m.42900 type:complete len:1014 (-) Transcript_23490:72-3113(-)